jgi:hypothetical protein
MLNLRFTVVAGMILAAAAARFVPHPWNFTPVTAMALFGGAMFAQKRFAFLVPMLALLASDVLIGALGLYGSNYGIFYGPAQTFVYGAFLMIVGLGLWLRSRRRPLPIAAAALASSVIFYIVSNFPWWAFGNLYPKTLDGLVQCYAAALPFFGHSVLGDLAYTCVLFGGFALASSRLPALQAAEAIVATIDKTR